MNIKILVVVKFRSYKKEEKDCIVFDNWSI